NPAVKPRGTPPVAVRSGACSGRRSFRKCPSAPLARAGSAVRTRISVRGSCSLLGRLSRDWRRLVSRRRVMKLRGAEMSMGLGSVAARNRDVELGITPHTVLGDVQAGGLDVLLDPNPPQPLQRPEAAERGCEGEAA